MPRNTKETLKKAYDCGTQSALSTSTIWKSCGELLTLVSSLTRRLSCRHPVPPANARATGTFTMVMAAVEDTGLPIALHLIHGSSFELCKDFIDGGFTGNIDGSHLSFEENVELTKSGIMPIPAITNTVEGELGQLAGIED